VLHGDRRNGRGGCPGVARLANTITLETAPLGAGFTGPVTENGFTYSRLSGGLFVSVGGNPGQDMEGTEAAGGGVLKIVSATGGNFNFNDIDFAAFDNSGTGSQTLMVEGFLGGSPVGTDSYTVANNSSWTTEAASVLAGKIISELDIPLNAGASPTTFSENIDNVVLTPAAVPAPLIGHGLPALLAVAGLLFGATRLERSKKRGSRGATIRHAAT
jgi:hypothetical protein